MYTEQQIDQPVIITRDIFSSLFPGPIVYVQYIVSVLYTLYDIVCCMYICVQFIQEPNWQ